MASIGRMEVCNEEAEKFLREIGNSLKAACPKGWVFTLLLASVGEGGSMFYASNGERESIIASMQEFIQKFREN